MSAAGGDTRIDGGDSVGAVRICASHMPPGVRGGVRPCSRERTAPRNGDDDDGDAFPAKRRRRSAPEQSEWGMAVRMSSRNGRKVTNYTEDYHEISDEDDPFEDHVEAAAAPVVETEEDQIEGVFGHERDEAHLDDPEDIPTENMRFVIKWKGYSHLHDTHELYEFLKRFPGFKRVNNYIKSVWQPIHDISTNPEATREDLETLQIQRERQRELLASVLSVMSMNRTLAELVQHVQSLLDAVNAQ